MSNSQIKTYNFKYIPKFVDSESKWYKSVNANPSDVQDTSVVLFKKILEKNYIVRLQSTMYSLPSTFRNVISNGELMNPNSKFLIKRVSIKVNESLSKYINVIKFGINENMSDTADTDPDTSSLGFNKQSFLTNKLSEDTYSVLIDDDSGAVIDTDVDKDKLFNFWIDGVHIENLDPLNLTRWYQDEILYDISKLVLFEIQVEGYYIRDSINFNKNNLDSSLFQVSVFEYIKKVNIFELDGDSNPNQIAELSIAKKTENFFNDGTKEWKARNYYFGKGVIYNVDISSTNNTTTTNVKTLKIKGGQLSIRKQTDNANATKFYTSFYVVVDDSDLSKLPNPLDNRMYMLTETTQANADNLYLSNPL
jgi:hypothetical protein